MVQERATPGCRRLNSPLDGGGRDGWSRIWAGHGGGCGRATWAGRAGLAGRVGRAAGRGFLGLGQGQRFASSNRIRLTQAAVRRDGRDLGAQWRGRTTLVAPSGLETCDRPGVWPDGQGSHQGGELCVCVPVCTRVCVFVHVCVCARTAMREVWCPAWGPVHPWREAPTP